MVEGRYDRIRVLSAVEALVVETDGFGIFRDKEKAALLQTLARERGLIVLTDSDAAGFVIRDHLSGLVPPEQIRHAYIPEVPGKEKRKAAPSREGLLGGGGDGRLHHCGGTAPGRGDFCRRERRDFVGSF